MAVAVGFEPQWTFTHTLSSPRSGTVVRVRVVLNEPVRGGRRTQPNDNERDEK
jgi:hypothetical protein